MVRMKRCATCFYADVCCHSAGDMISACENYISCEEQDRKNKEAYKDEWNTYLELHDAEHWFLDNN